jgi:putative Mg2+ transporter-C (MgtC) family protein
LKKSLVRCIKDLNSPLRIKKVKTRRFLYWSAICVASFDLTQLASTLCDLCGVNLESILNDLGIGPFDARQIAVFAFRLFTAAILASILGLEREAKGRAAGFRTHMLVALGAALFTMVPVEAAEGDPDLANIVKGIAAGVGFLGAGAILKKQSEEEIEGITTAASIWLTAAMGLAVGAGQIVLATIATVIAWTILYILSAIVSNGGQKK